MIPTIQLKYMVHNAKVKINLPNQGECWFFIDPVHTVGDFTTEVKLEDQDAISSLKILRSDKAGGAPKAVGQSEILYEQL